MTLVFAGCGHDKAQVGVDGGQPETPLPPTCERAQPAESPTVAEPWSWDFGDADYQQGISIFAGADGTVYLAGRFAGAVDIGGDHWQGQDSSMRTAPTDPVIYDSFISRLDQSGRPLWSRRFPSNVGVNATALAGDAFLLGGRWRGDADFGRGNITTSAAGEGFVALYDACGQLSWVKRFPVTDAESSIFVASVSAAGDDALLMAGTFRGRLDFDTGPLLADDDGAATTAFVVGLDATGVHQWTEVLGADVSDLSVAGDAAGHVYLTGTRNHAFFATGLARGGLAPWSVVDGAMGATPGATGLSSARALGLDASGNLIASGGFINRTVDLGGGASAPYQCCGANSFIAQLSSGGTARWLRSLGSWSGPTAIGRHGIVVAAQWDGYTRVHTFDETGTERDGGWQVGGGTGFNTWFGIALDPWDRLLATGWFMNGIDLGSGGLKTAGGLDMDGFVARLPAD